METDLTTFLSLKQRLTKQSADRGKEKQAQGKRSGRHRQKQAETEKNSTLQQGQEKPNIKATERFLRCALLYKCVQAPGRLHTGSSIQTGSNPGQKHQTHVLCGQQRLSTCFSPIFSPLSSCTPEGHALPEAQPSAIE